MEQTGDFGLAEERTPSADERPRSRAAAALGRHRRATWLIGAFVAVTLVAPAAPVNKFIFLILLLWLLFDMLFARRPRIFPSLAPLVICAIFAYGFSLSLVNESDLAMSFQFLSATFVLFLAYFVYQHDVDLDKVARVASIIVLCGTVMFWLSIFMPELPFAQAIYQFFYDYNFSAATERDFFEGGGTFTLQLGTTPFLFIAFCVFSLRFFSPQRRWIDAPMMLLIAAAIVVSGLRGLIAITAVFALTLVVRSVRPSLRIVILVGLAVLAYGLYFAYLQDSLVLSSDEISNAVKIGHFMSFFDDASPWSLAFGRGLASYYYSSGSSALKAYTELTPIDMLRYFGVALTGLLYAVITFPLGGLKRYVDHRAIYVWAFLLFVALSMTNPVMFNSYGMLVVLWYWQKIQSDEKGTAA